MGISTSGNSKNVIEALKLCKESGIKTIGLTGANTGAMGALCDICIKVPSTETPRIQESHILIGHIICCIVEEELFGGGKPKF
jgi:D-sedoheptulose 7-phosphate isomerase